VSLPCKVIKIHLGMTKEKKHTKKHTRRVISTRHDNNNSISDFNHPVIFLIIFQVLLNIILSVADNIILIILIATTLFYYLLFLLWLYI
jgi:hypothetical protein